jgi:hypothetical protein
LHARGAEVLGRLDALGDLREQAVAPMGIRMYVRGEHLTTMTFAPDQRETVQALFVSQAAVEQRLRDRLTELGVEVEWHRGIEAIEQDDDRVTVLSAPPEHQQPGAGEDPHGVRMPVPAGDRLPVDVPRRDRADIGWHRGDGRDAGR